MRPDDLDPLFAPARSLSGVGPKMAVLIARALGVDEDELRVRDLLFHLPTGIIDRRLRPSLTQLPPSGVVTVELEVERHDAPPPGSRRPWRVIASNGSGAIEILFFGAKAEWIRQALPVGAKRIVSGPIEWYDYRAQMTHPDVILPLERASELQALEPTYRLTAGLTQKPMRRAVQHALERVPKLAEWLSADVLAARSWPSFGEALARLHRPENPQDVEPEGAPWQRLAYDEMLASQLALALARGATRREQGEAWSFAGMFKQRIIAALPFKLTPSQDGAIDDIETDLRSGRRMLRLLQGDVGSGKTLVALIGMASVAEAGGQAALMAPTELLARQHFATIAPLAEKAGLKTALLLGKDRGGRREAAEGIASGEVDLIIGTHALFQSGFEFKNLGLVVVDEQHRFGVHQRMALAGKGTAPDILVMTATPIPRTLVLSAFGDMDVSQLTEKPAGRQKIDTRIVSLERLDEVVARIRTAIGRGEKAYWVCPLVSESEAVDLAAAEDRYAALRRVLGERVGLIHGRMPAGEKDAAMARFQAGETRVLVSTTVVEVGVDVSDATIMVVEHAERFGLAQLHQLRGRVGRGSKPSSCVLLYNPPLGQAARARLAILRETEDGFRIAEEDLRLRGEGDVLGVRQSGMPGFHVALPDRHGELLGMARADARLILLRDPEFRGERAEALRRLLYLFGRDEAVRLMRAG